MTTRILLGACFFVWICVLGVLVSSMPSYESMHPRIMTVADIECVSPNTIFIKKGTYYDLPTWVWTSCGFEIYRIEGGH